jgi:ABC-2 type transport system ATP-binding protein
LLAIETRGISKSFDAHKAVDSIDLSINQGEIFGLLGPNGAGKTTLISMLVTIMKPTSGTATVNGFDIIRQKDDVRKSIGIVFQDPSLDDRLTGMENLRMHAGLYGVPKGDRERRISEVLGIVGLSDRANEIVRNYSGGMKRRLEIARGLIHYPKILFLDEPTIGLDPQTREHIWEYIKALAKRENITVIITTHYLEEADSLCDRVAIMDNGQIKVLDNPEVLKKALEGDIVTIEVAEADSATEKLKDFEDVKKTTVLGNKINIYVKDGEKFAPKVLDHLRKEGMHVNSISIRKPTLGDVFLHYTGKEIREENGDGKDSMRMRFRMRHGH